jgi:hypothetical protein
MLGLDQKNAILGDGAVFHADDEVRVISIKLEFC